MVQRNLRPPFITFFVSAKVKRPPSSKDRNSCGLLSFFGFFIYSQERAVMLNRTSLRDLNRDFLLGV
jgi:hypothetical protein